MQLFPVWLVIVVTFGEKILGHRKSIGKVQRMRKGEGKEEEEGEMVIEGEDEEGGVGEVGVIVVVIGWRITGVFTFV